jgi:hypothetical protein
MEKEIRHLIVADLIGNDTAVSTDDGDSIFQTIQSAFKSEQLVNLDFERIHLLTTAFLNAAIGQLYSSYDSIFLNQNLKLSNVADEDKILFLKVVERAKEYFSDKKGFEDSANNALYGSK